MTNQVNSQLNSLGGKEGKFFLADFQINGFADGELQEIAKGIDQNFFESIKADSSGMLRLFRENVIEKEHIIKWLTKGYSQYWGRIDRSSQLLPKMLKNLLI
jgi:hypothetical protein